ncbi:MAG: hypothetical protein VYE46_05675 [Cyanobacteriota bacterium]|nr:hypothetical protein [Cyanobacteriota bacterium]
MGRLVEASQQDGLALQGQHRRSGSKGHDSSPLNAALAFQQPNSVARERQPARRKQRSEPYKQNQWHHKCQEQMHH